MDHFDNLLKDLGNNIGLPDLKPSGKGLCSLRFDDKVTIDLECHEQSGVLTFSCIVGTVAEHEAAAFYPQFLEANLLWGGTGGATLGVDRTTMNVFLCYQEHLEEMDFPRFQQLLKGFSDTALFWYQRLQQGPGVNAAPTTPAPAPEELPGSIPPGVLAYA